VVSAQPQVSGSGDHAGDEKTYPLRTVVKQVFIPGLDDSDDERADDERVNISDAVDKGQTRKKTRASPPKQVSIPGSDGDSADDVRSLHPVVKQVSIPGFDDSDDEAPVKQQNKTQKKKEERKISDKPVRVAGAKTMEAGGFEFVSNQPSTRGRDGERGRGGRGGRGGERGRGRGGDRRGGRGGDRRGGRGDGERRPAPQRLDADGNPIEPVNRPRRDHASGKEGDRKDRTGRGRRDNQRDGHGRGNTGTDEAVTYKQKGAPSTDAPAEEAKVPEEEKKPEPKPVEMETIGVSIDDFLTGKTKTVKKEARATEGLKSKAEAFTH
jgi:hypothetical protein